MIYQLVTFCFVVVDDVQQVCVNAGLDVKTVLDRRAGSERLSVLRCTHQSHCV